MGTYDSFIGYWKCPECDYEGVIEVQTKKSASLLNLYLPGDRVLMEERDPEFTLKETYVCEHCSTHMFEFSEGLWIQERKDKWREWEVLIKIRNRIYEEMIFTGESKIVNIKKFRKKLIKEANKEQ